MTAFIAGWGQPHALDEPGDFSLASAYTIFDLVGERVWVTGHHGMVGSAIIRRLRNEPCEVLTAASDEEDFLLNENESIYIPVGEEHRLANPGKIPLQLIEVQSGSYLSKDDVVRLDDVYGRESEG